MELEGGGLVGLGLIDCASNASAARILPIRS